MSDVYELVQDPSLETGLGWQFFPTADDPSERRQTDPYHGAWHGYMESHALLPSVASVIATLNPATRGSIVTVSLATKAVEFGVPVDPMVIAVAADPGDGSTVFIGPGFIAPGPTYAVTVLGTFTVIGHGPLKIQMFASGDAGAIYFDSVHATTPKANPYPPGGPIFIESYFDDLSGTIHKRDDMTRDSQDRLVQDYDLDEPDRDDLLIDWPLPEEREDIEP